MEFRCCIILKTYNKWIHSLCGGYWERNLSNYTTMKEWIKRNFKEKLITEKLLELDLIMKQIELDKCTHEKTYFDLDKMDEVCRKCKKTIYFKTQLFI